jgi:iron complex transport system substrate-binding protein
MILYGGFVGDTKGEAAFAGIQQACNNPTVLDLGGFVYITENMAAATGDTLESSILTRFGVNLAEEGRGYVFDLADLLENQPDVILLSSVITRDSVERHAVLSQLDAVAAGRVIVLNNAYFERPSSRLTNLIFDLRIQYESLI